jgi:glycosyltransferase involved in cell wall biosynthesis
MAAGRAVVLGIDGVIREVVERARAGVFFPPGDAGALADAVRGLMDAPDQACIMGERGRAAVCAEFDRRRHAEAFERLLRELVPAGVPAAAPARRPATA